MGTEEEAVSLFLKLEYDLEEWQGGLEGSTDMQKRRQERGYSQQRRSEPLFAGATRGKICPWTDGFAYSSHR